MKRYRISSFDFDSRPIMLNNIKDDWDDNVKEQHIQNQKKIIEDLKIEYGEFNFQTKLNNFIELKQKPFSISAFHNKFLQQIRNAYVIGSYYPALISACSLGERILNHLILLLRDYYKETEEYKKIFRKNSFDNWKLAIDTLESWKILLPEAIEKFRELHEKRNFAVHFNPETDYNDKKMALDAIHLIQDIVTIQFSAFGAEKPWILFIPGEVYIKKEWENNPFVKNIFIPNALLVGSKHKIESLIPKIIVNDNFEYEELEITDEEFSRLRQNNK